MASAFRELGIEPDFREIAANEPAGTVINITSVGQEVEVPATITVYVSGGAPEMPQPKVQSVAITYANNEKNDVTMTTDEQAVFRARINPVGTGENIIWTSSDPDVFEVAVINAEATQAQVTAIGTGNAVLTVSVDGVRAECTIRVRQPST